MGRNDPPLDATIRVVTPENIAFEYRLAGPFRRLPAFLLDFCVGSALLIALSIVLEHDGWHRQSRPGHGASVLLLFFVIWWFYGVLFETFMNGQTPGKYVLGLRVLDR